MLRVRNSETYPATLNPYHVIFREVRTQFPGHTRGHIASPARSNSIYAMTETKFTTERSPVPRLSIWFSRILSHIGSFDLTDALPVTCFS